MLNSRIGAGLGKIFGMNRGEPDARVTYFLDSTDISYVSLFIYCYCWYLIRPSIYNRGTSKYFSKLTERTLFLVVSRRLSLFMSMLRNAAVLRELRRSKGFQQLFVTSLYLEHFASYSTHIGQG